MSSLLAIAVVGFSHEILYPFPSYKLGFLAEREDVRRELRLSDAQVLELTMLRANYRASLEKLMKAADPYRIDSKNQARLGAEMAALGRQMLLRYSVIFSKTQLKRGYELCFQREGHRWTGSKLLQVHLRMNEDQVRYANAASSYYDDLRPPEPTWGDSLEDIALKEQAWRAWQLQMWADIRPILSQAQLEEYLRLRGKDFTFTPEEINDFKFLNGYP